MLLHEATRQSELLSVGLCFAAGMVVDHPAEFPIAELGVALRAEDELMPGQVDGLAGSQHLIRESDEVEESNHLRQQGLHGLSVDAAGVFDLGAKHLVVREEIPGEPLVVESRRMVGIEGHDCLAPIVQTIVASAWHRVGYCAQGGGEIAQGRRSGGLVRAAG